MAETTAKKNGFFEYLKGVRAELKKVTWPTKQETVKLTAIVFVVCAAFAVFFWLIDTGCLALLEEALNITM
ncbi:MAG: preprotein translocase subunit SecE [Firmicutes bacterium]|nr:preprotein translocase subunit SecE [Bacillota bacterium]MBR5926110.1 preprotein translocase subunit SecE [Bacillota bacterium]MBR6025560.1 preprotein translocase subunit SecE [Bacillota bacterium]